MPTPAENLRAAARTLREAAPELTGHLADLANPVAEWLDVEAYRLETKAEGRALLHALNVARAVNGSQP